jgi:predicted aspartyl protease
VLEITTACRYIIPASGPASSTDKMRQNMGITYISGTVTGPNGQRTLQFLVDSGATYTLLPFDVWQGIGLTSKRSVTFSLVDGTKVERKVSECHVALDVGEGHSPVILGEPGDEALLGVVTLENLGLVFNPFTRTLHPMHLLLASVH